jgi:hypothetical protein
MAKTAGDCVFYLVLMKATWVRRWNEEKSSSRKRFFSHPGENLSAIVGWLTVGAEGKTAVCSPRRGFDGRTLLAVLNERRYEYANSAADLREHLQESFRMPKADGINRPAFLAIPGSFHL